MIRWLFTLLYGYGEGGRQSLSPPTSPFESKGEWFPPLFQRPATHLQNPQGPTYLPFSQNNKVPVFLGAALSQAWVCAMDPSQGAREPNRQKAPQSHLAVSFSSCFSCNSLFVQPGADGGSEHLRVGGKSFQQHSLEHCSMLWLASVWLHLAPRMSPPWPAVPAQGAVCSDGSRRRRGSRRKSHRWQVKLDQNRRPHLHGTSTDRIFFLLCLKSAPLQRTLSFLI